MSIVGNLIRIRDEILPDVLVALGEKEIKPPETIKLNEIAGYIDMIGHEEEEKG